MSKQAERPLWGTAGIAIAMLLLVLTVGALAASNPPSKVPQQPVYTGHPLDKLDRELTLDAALPDYCRDCLINKNCSWAWESAWKEYVDMFGTDELSKVTSSELRYE